MLPSHRSPALSVRSPRKPVGNPGLCSGTGYSLALPVLGSSRPRNCSPKLEYQAMPSASITTSCGWMVSRGRSYSVMTTRVARPFGRGSVLSRVVPLRARAQIDAAEKVGHAAVDLHALVPALFHPPLAAAKLRSGRDALVHVALHARQRDVDEIVAACGSSARPARACGSRRSPAWRSSAGRCRGSLPAIRRSTSARRGPRSCAASGRASLAVAQPRRRSPADRDRIRSRGCGRVFAGLSLAAGKLYRPCASLTTVTVMVEPAFLALTRTPSIAPSSAEKICPVSVCA